MLERIERRPRVLQDDAHTLSIDLGLDQDDLVTLLAKAPVCDDVRGYLIHSEPKPVRRARLDASRFGGLQNIRADRAQRVQPGMHAEWFEHCGYCSIRAAS
jgi:hypothetical protein